MNAHECHCGRWKRRDAEYCDGHTWGWLCSGCDGIKPLNRDLCSRCTAENAKDNERTTAPPALRLIRGEG